MFDGPDWRGNPRQRLRMSVVLAAVVVALLLSLFKIPDAPVIAPIGELLVKIVREEPKEEPVLEPVTEPITEPAPPISEPATETVGSVDAATAREEEREWTDWDKVAADTVAKMAEHPPDPTYSVNPRLERLREEARVKFRASEAPVEKPIWENVERDMTGRLVLRSGNCIRVLDDPNVGNRVKFEVFGQYMAECMYSKEKPKELPWVAEINARREGPSRYAPPSVE